MGAGFTCIGGLSLELEKVNFSFTNQCNMRCDFCYVPFRSSAIDEAKINRIVSRISELKIKKVVISGGDPFLYKKLIQLLMQFFESGHAVHLDSNFKNAPLNFLEQLEMAKIVPSFGLPLDGSNENFHSLMRGEKKHFQTVCHWISRLVSAGFDVKVNTVVSSKNIDDLWNIEKLLNTLKIKRWSLYQFWPMATGLENAEKHSIDIIQFDSIVSDLVSHSDIAIGGGSIEERKSNYMFVRSDGGVYTVDPANYHLYVELGSIFDANILERWSQINGVVEIDAGKHAVP